MTNLLIAVPTIRPFSDWRVVVLFCGHTDAITDVIKHRALIGMDFPCNACRQWMPIINVIAWKP